MSPIGGSIVGFRSIAPAVYAGPGDIVASAAAWFGLRAYTNASIGANAIRLRRSSDNAEQDFATVAGGGIDLTAITSFKGAANLFVTKLYDQTGNGNVLSQATAGNQPAFTLSGLGSLPIITFDGVSNHTLSNGAESLTISAPTSLSWVAINTAASSAQDAVWSSANGNFQAQYNNSGANQVLIYAGTVLSATASDSNWHALAGVFNGASSDMVVGGTSNTGNTGGSSGDTTEFLGGISGGTTFAGSLTEMG